MNNVTLSVSSETLSKMQEFYKDDLVINNNQYVVFCAQIDDCTITAYKTNKVLFQGKKAIDEKALWDTDFTYFTESIGSDEVGTGDYFGPVVVVSAYLAKENIKEVKKFKIADSKTLTDEYIQEIAPKLFTFIPYSLLVVHNEKYNEIMSSDMNLNKLKALLHKQAITNLLNKINLKPPIIIDQFCTQANFQKYVNDISFTESISFHTKAENKFASVAIASIMARYIFLRELDKLSKSLNTSLLKGASKFVDYQGKELVQKYGKDILNKVAKLHFNNTKKILNQ